MREKRQLSEEVVQLYKHLHLHLQLIIFRVYLIQFRRFRQKPLKFDISRTKPHFKNPFDKFWGLNMLSDPVKFCENRISSFREKRVTD